MKKQRIVAVALVSLLLVGTFIIGWQTKAINALAANASYQAICHIAALTKLTQERTPATPLLEHLLYGDMVNVARIKNSPEWRQCVFINPRVRKQMDEAVNRYIHWREMVGTNLSLPHMIPMDIEGDPQQIEAANRIYEDGNRLIEQMIKDTQQAN
ncbi:MAG: hypothetical protein HYV35_07595 [Lentisphaerae bacterium]|nr:hypothetical protein [Lentisphaerota bacterium]